MRDKSENYPITLPFQPSYVLPSLLSRTVFPDQFYIPVVGWVFLAPVDLWTTPYAPGEPNPPIRAVLLLPRHRREPHLKTKLLRRELVLGQDAGIAAAVAVAQAALPIGRGCFK